MKRLTTLLLLAMLVFVAPASAADKTIAMGDRAISMANVRVFDNGDSSFSLATKTSAWVPIASSYQQISPSTVQTLTVPAAAKHAIISIESGAGIRWLDDGATPTATFGQLLLAGDKWIFPDARSVLLAMKILHASGASPSTLNISYYRDAP